MRGLLLPVLLLLAAEAAAQLGGVQSDTLAPPSAALLALGQAGLDGSLWSATGQTLGAALAGWALGSGLGLLAAAALGLSPALARLFSLPVEFLRPIPSVALLPLALLVFGFGFRLEISVVSFACFWPVLIVGGAAVAQVEPRLLEVARILRLSWAARVGKVVLPAALPRVFVALRLAAAVALVVAVTAEIAINPIGLGFQMMQAQQMLQSALMLGLLFWIGLLGWGLNRALLLAQQRLFGLS